MDPNFICATYGNNMVIKIRSMETRTLINSTFSCLVDLPFLYILSITDSETRLLKIRNNSIKSQKLIYNANVAVQEI